MSASLSLFPDDGYATEKLENKFPIWLVRTNLQEVYRPFQKLHNRFRVLLLLAKRIRKHLNPRFYTVVQD